MSPHFQSQGNSALLIVSDPQCSVLMQPVEDRWGISDPQDKCESWFADAESLCGYLYTHPWHCTTGKRASIHTARNKLKHNDHHS